MLLLALAAAWAPTALALPDALEAARRDGIVGEQVDGYLGLVKGDAPADIRKQVDSVNAQRREKYAEKAKERNTDVATFAAITGKKLVEDSPAGSFVRGADGRWVKR
jgi:uncharacterized protein YdbL (DUF1318 family)